jgi:hypothetical protein
MASRKQCQFCARRYSYEDAYVSHIRRVHPTLIRFVPRDAIPNDQYRIRSDTIEVPEIVLREEVPATESDDEGEIDNNGVEVQICPRDAPKQPQATTIAFNGAGSPRGDPFDLDDDEMDPFRPFRTEEEYRLARWTVKHRLTKAAIDDLTTFILFYLFLQRGARGLWPIFRKRRKDKSKARQQRKESRKTTKQQNITNETPVLTLAVLRSVSVPFSPYQENS